MQTTQFSGLANQGATCYMNSLLQTLFMTPEFVRRLFSWQHLPDTNQPKEKCVPHQLQLLIARLVLRESSVVETTGLTQSFQQNTFPSFEQQDVQEFCQRLFDAIESRLKGSPQASLISDLYEGYYTQFIECLACKQLSFNRCTFHELLLTVKDITSNIYNDTLGKGLSHLLAVEKLCGENQYHCETCYARQDAAKGIRLEIFPHILVFQLNRLAIDLKTGIQYKINDPVAFPLLLNLNPMYRGEPAQEFYADFPEYIITNNEEQPRDSIPHGKDVLPLLPDLIIQDRVSNAQAELRQSGLIRQGEGWLKSGPEVFELFSVLVHSGDVSGGHYFAYIKDLQSSRWFMFNDALVKHVSLEQVVGDCDDREEPEVKKANPYLLVYRRFSIKRVDPVTNDEVPDYIQTELKEANRKEASLSINVKKSQRADDWIKVYAYYQRKQLPLFVRRDTQLSTLKVLTKKKLKINAELADMRVRGYSAWRDVYLSDYLSCEHMTLQELKIDSNFNIAIEVKNPSSAFKACNSLIITVKVVNWTNSSDRSAPLDEILSAFTLIEFPLKAKLETAQDILMSMFDIKPENQLIFIPSKIPVVYQIRELDTRTYAHTLLQDCGIFHGSFLLLEERNSGSFWQTKYQEVQDYISIRCITPDEVPPQILFLPKSSLIADLRRAIASRMNQDSDYITMRRYSQYGRELKELGRSLTGYKLHSGSRVYISLEPFCPPNCARITALYTQSQNNESVTLKKLFTINLLREQSSEELLQQLLQAAKTLCPEVGIDASCTVLRSVSSGRLSALLNDPVLSLTDGMQIAIQNSPELKMCRENTRVIRVRTWCQSQSLFGAAIEIGVDKNMKMRELVTYLAERFSLCRSRLRAVRCQPLELLDEQSFKSEPWVSLDTSDREIHSDPLFILEDGTQLFITDVAF